ncbi:MAG: PEP-CTERM sorting domain-containing protein, partial [Phycisphaerales bacterium]|nr:PEP-CTERM sorting domain-containing protein [Phycisphaerales bacterium]
NTDGSATLVSNSGTLAKTGGTGTSYVDDLVNTGTVKAQSGTLSLFGYIQTAGSTDLDGGGISGSVLDFQGGSLIGNGTVDASVAMAGVISPGHSIGALTIIGDATFASGGTLQIELSNLDNTSDLLTVGGLLDLTAAGDHLNLTGGILGQTYTIAGFNNITGQFDHVTSGYDVTYDLGNKLISVTAVPEPGTLGVLAMAGLTLLRRRRNRR